MEIEVGNFITAIENEDYHKETITARASDVDSMGVADVMVPVIDKFESSIKDNKLTQIELVIDYADGPVFVRLESGIINLPYSNIDKVDNFFNRLEEKVPVVVNLIVESPKLNASGFRIDTLGSVDEFLANPENYEVKIAGNIAEKIAVIESAEISEEDTNN
ncbi:hypothetical protein [Ligilactobacillus salivarius]|uniref:Uncharacterized protein n=3 Tax=Ligilactobacillus salivarius TaxID=1624 RepID=F7QTM8_9LACO|nr:hypothetical protein [Ligilactobacillus salivarius]EGM52108.1 hypothetical protein LSGJ_00528 [Ligilactobacillus salivarius GJ-24]EIA32943.1 hypothetical protein SMXD51_03003 [Ligilactobacillus salivarius SMXD51]